MVFVRIFKHVGVIMDSKQKSVAIAGLRRISYRWKPRSDALKAARVGRNEYECTVCKKVFGRKEVQLDHKEPVVPLTGWDGFDKFIERLLCYQEGFQVLCKMHHKIKTLQENKERRDYAKRKTGSTKKTSSKRGNKK